MILTVLIGAAVLGAAAGALGCFLQLQRRALMGDVLSHAALPGLCLALLIVGHRSLPALIAGAALTGLASFGVVLLIRGLTRVKDDAALGIALTTFFALGVVLMSVIERTPNISGKAGIDAYIYGQAAALGSSDLKSIGVAAAVAAIALIVFFRPLKTVSFDRGFAHALGWSTVGLDLLLMGLAAIVTVVGLQAVGVILISAMLIAPAAAARLWTDRLERMLWLAATFGAFSAAAGVLVSSGWLPLGWLTYLHADTTRGLPTGPSIVLCGAAIFAFSIVFSPKKGVVARLLRQATFKAQTGAENALRTLYELSETALPELNWRSISSVAKPRALRIGSLRMALRRLESRGDVVTRRDDVRLTRQGEVRAAELTRRHRLWELFLIHQAGVAADHVDRDADWLEHHLPPELLAEVELELPAVEQSRTRIPTSPHVLDRAEPPAKPGGQA